MKTSFGGQQKLVTPSVHFLFFKDRLKEAYTKHILTVSQLIGDLSVFYVNRKHIFFNNYIK